MNWATEISSLRASTYASTISDYEVVYPLELVVFISDYYKQVVPESSLGYHSNNQYDNFPPLMSDGRTVIASWQPESVTNDQMIKENGISSNWQYRKFLNEQAGELMKQNFREMSNDVGYFQRFNPADKNFDKNYNHPYNYDSYLSNEQPKGYSNSDLKDLYLSREQLNSRKVSPSITQYELMKLGKN
jgi:hypothetical protein